MSVGRESDDERRVRQIYRQKSEREGEGERWKERDRETDEYLWEP